MLGAAIFAFLFYYSGGKLSGAAELMFGLFALAVACVFLMGMLVRGRSYI